jgi:hypothetical protein
MDLLGFLELFVFVSDSVFFSMSRSLNALIKAAAAQLGKPHPADIILSI